MCVWRRQLYRQASGEALNRFVSLASDGRDDTYWWSQETPEPGAAWVALAVGLRGMVRCVRLLQSPDPDFAATAVQLQSRLVMSASPEGPVMAVMMEVPENSRTVARHTFPKLFPEGPELRSCPNIDEQLVREPRFGQLCPKLATLGQILNDLGQI